jgi:F420-dependent oxidoreductase-like protein
MEPEVALENMGTFVDAVHGLKFEAAWIYDHLLPWPGDTNEPVFECWTSLTALASRTETLRLGTMVTCVGYRNPALLAKMAATFDVISHGRLEMGVGAGWYQREYEAYGYGFEPASVRGLRLRESVEVMLGLWTDDVVTYRGRTVSVDRARCTPKPLQDPHPPIWIGGRGERLVLPAAARLAQAWNISGPTIEEFEHKNRRLDAECVAIGRDPTTLRRTVEADCLLARNHLEVERLVTSHARATGQVPETIRQRQFIGTPEQIAKRIRSFRDAHCEGFVLWFGDAPATNMMEAFATEVLPLSS